MLDASALLAFVLKEPGKEVVAKNLTNAVISTVNLSEVAAKLSERGFEHLSIRALLPALGMEIVPFDSEDAFAAGELRAATRPLGLSFGDRACIALARKREIPIATSDSAFHAPSLGLKILTIC